MWQARRSGNAPCPHSQRVKGKNDWERKMLYMHRKTLVVCAECNAKSRAVISKMMLQMESRIHGDV